MFWYECLDEKAKEYLPDLKIACDEPMSRHTSFHIGGPAKRMAFPASRAQAVLVAHFARECGARTLVLGNGTNLLTADEGLDMLVINLSRSLTSIRRTGECSVEADAGVSLARLADFVRKDSLTGLEFAHGIPGSLGGAVCMNAGAYGGEMCQVVEEVTALFPDGVRTLKGDKLKFGYRHSIFSDQADAVVLSAVLRLQCGDEQQIKAQMEELMRRRKASQPLEYPSAGSTFKRPAGQYAGTLIDQCGLKGRTVGGAQVSEKHAGFIINRGGATCADVTELIRLVQETVLRESGVQLEPEVRIIR
ncbi:UDP-N-acetylmuramate dehydrogenase [Oscillibacter sp. MSJ-2]|uniref:UDP-N-acetylenolpyruvoylglucosamine reductase n=1 Tax=Dysosmobacter acutus TaxID=2841504 RepID=A0ABS6FCN9_9FIRM|nr:UDP-N-acetylmuramate dehydrogenase [Dysosmobacter acutus]MBU5627160.1 UDP-N-acetylmuramate dehydrogenase [Dysosmobacter acutus]